MPNRDYAARSNRSGKGGVNKLLILVIILLLLGASALALMLLKAKEPVTPAITQPVITQQPKSELPTPPAEIYSYIRDLETREVPIDKNTKTVQLTKEQELQLQQQREELRKQELANQQLAQQQAAQQVAEQMQAESTIQSPQTEVKPAVKALTPEELAAKKAAEQKAAEEKRKLAEQQKQDAQKNTAKTQDATPTKVVAKPANDAPKVVGKFGLQCGAFKNKAQAENMQARLAMAGYNARIASSGEWNRVFVGPVGDRAAASKAQANARSVAECMIVGM